MTAPNVGKVVLGVGIDESQLTRDVLAAIQPELQKFTAEVAKANKELEKVKSDPFEEVAAQARDAASELGKVSKASDQLAQKEQDLLRLEERKRKAIKDRAAAQHEVNKEIREEGTATTASAEKLRIAQANAQRALSELDRKRKQVANARTAMAKAEIAEEQSVADAVSKARAQAVAAIQKHVDEQRKATQKNIDSAYKESDAAIAAARKQLEARDKAMRDETAAYERELAARERASSRAEQNETRRQRRLADSQRSNLAKALNLGDNKSAIGDIGRGLFNVGNVSGGAMAALTEGIVIAIGAAGELTKSLLVIPGAAAGAALGIGSLVVGLHGFDDVIKNIGDDKKFATAIQNIAPNAQQAALAIKQMVPLFHELHQAVQNALFAGSVTTVRDLVARLEPQVRSAMVSISTIFNTGLRGIVSRILTPENSATITTTLNQMVAAFRALLPAVQPFTDAMIMLVKVGADMLPGMSRGISDMAAKFGKFINDAAQSGKLRDWMRQGLTMAAGLAKGLYEIGRAIIAIGPVVQQILPGLVSLLTKMADVLKAHPGLIYAIPLAFISWRGIVAVATLMNSLDVVKTKLGKEIPEAAETSRKKLAAVNAESAISEAGVGTAGVAGSTAAVKGASQEIEQVGEKASRTAGIIKNTLSNELRTVGSLLSTGLPQAAGAFYLFDQILAQNTRSTEAVQKLHDAIVQTKDAQDGLMGALLASGGGPSTDVSSALSERLKAMVATIQGQATSSASALDRLRDANDGGSIVGGLFNRIGKSIASTFSGNFGDAGTGDTIAGQKDALAKQFQPVLDVLQKQFGTNMDELSKQVFGSRDIFEALVKNLDSIGPAGAKAADELTKVRQEVLGSQEAAEKAGPILQKLGPDVASSAADIKTAFAALPKDVPIHISDVGGQSVLDILQKLGQSVRVDNDKTIKVDAPLAPDVLEALKALGIQVTTNNDKTISVHLDQQSLALANTQLDQLAQKLTGVANLMTGVFAAPNAGTLGVPAPPGFPTAPGGIAPALNPPTQVALPPGLAGLPGISALAPTPINNAPNQPLVPPPGSPDQKPPQADVGAPPGPDGYPVPPKPEKPESEADKKKAIEAQFDPKNFQVDPFAQIGGVQNQPGYPGQQPLNVAVANMPSAVAMPGMSMPSMPNAATTAGMPQLGAIGTDQASIAKAIFSASTAAGYSPAFGQSAVAAALLESSLSPTADNGTHNSLFQTSHQYNVGSDPASQIQWFLQAAANAGGPSAANADPMNFIANQIEKGGYPGSNYQQFMAQAQSLIGGQAATPAATMPMVAAMPGMRSALGDQGAAAGSPSVPPPNENQMRALIQGAFGIPNSFGTGSWENATHPPDDGWHGKGYAFDFHGNTQQMDALANWIAQNAAQQTLELIHQGPGFNTANDIKNTKFGDVYGPALDAEHADHVHWATTLQPQQLAALLQGSIPPGLQIPGVGQTGQTLPTSLRDNMFAQNQPLTIDPTTGKAGYFQVNSQEVQDANQALVRAGAEASKDLRQLSIVQEEQRQNLATEQDVIDARNKVNEDMASINKDQQDLAEKQRGTFKDVQPTDYSKLPFGDPRRILAGAITGAGGSQDDVSAIIGGVIGSAAAPIGDAVGTATSDALTAIAPGYGPNQASALTLGTPTSQSTNLDKLVTEGNPLAVASAAGFPVPDYTRAGSPGSTPANMTLSGGPPSDAQGNIYSDTAALIDRTMTGLDAENKARFDQELAVLNEIKDKVSEQVIKPIITDAVKQALEGLSDAAGKAIGTPMGTSAGPIIGDAVAKAIPSSSSSGNDTGVGGQLVNTAYDAVSNAIDPSGGPPGGAPSTFFGGPGDYLGGFAPLRGGIMGELYDEGGLWPSGTFGTNLSGGVERVLSPEQTKAFDAGLLGSENLPFHPATGMQALGLTAAGRPIWPAFGAAAAPNVDVTDTVGAEFFGVSQVPILGAIVNLLVSVLLKVLGVQITARDTLDNISKDFRTFRGDFKAFDAAGRLLNDTSGLVDRSSTSEQEAADERIRILETVITALIKYIIDKIIVPVGKAVADSLVNAAAGAAGGAISGAFPGGSIVGGAVQSVISSAGNAAVDIGANIFTDFANSLTQVGVSAVGEGLQSYFPSIMTWLFGGGGTTAATTKAVVDPLSSLLSSLFSPFLALIGGMSTVAGPGLTYDEGGIASGTGLMPKAILSPERVLSPGQTALFDRMVAALERGHHNTATSNMTVSAPITMYGSSATPQAVSTHLLSALS
ncbi:MAG: hypothetical protein JOY78_00195 [Pseudonocardia sp.]|nr:hypothetical protein [Pseudonocardia sp.]